MNLFQFRTAIATLDEATLRQFNQVLVAQINASTRARQAAATRSFNVGQVVKFNDRGGVERKMRIDRINVKTVSGVDLSSGMNWRVSPSFLSLCEEERPAGTTLHAAGKSVMPGAPSKGAPTYGVDAGIF
jgi:hypothetical protein